MDKKSTTPQKNSELIQFLKEDKELFLYHPNSDNEPNIVGAPVVVSDEQFERLEKLSKESKK